MILDAVTPTSAMESAGKTCGRTSERFRATPPRTLTLPLPSARTEPSPRTSTMPTATLLSLLLLELPGSEA